MHRSRLRWTAVWTPHLSPGFLGVALGTLLCACGNSDTKDSRAAAAGAAAIGPGGLAGAGASGGSGAAQDNVSETPSPAGGGGSSSGAAAPTGVDNGGGGSTAQGEGGAHTGGATSIAGTGGLAAPPGPVSQNTLLPKHWHESKGFGTTTKGGLAGEVYKVTNLSNSGPGSLRDALSSGNRLVVFEVAGTIDLEEQSIDITSNNVTVAGQTAPSPGISVIRGNFAAKGNDIVVSHINLMLGNISLEEDTSNILGTNVVFDHVGAYWARDEVLSLHHPNNVTVYKSIIAEGLQYTNHVDGEHSKGSLINKNPKQLSLIGNLYAHNALRNPRVKAGEIFIANHIVYHWAPGWDHTGPKWSPGMVPNEDSFNVVVSARLGCNISLVGSVGIKGPESVGEHFLAGHYGKPHSANGYLDDNIIIDAAGKPLIEVDTATIDVVDKPAVWPEGMVPMPAHEALYEGLRTVGPRPGARDFHTARVVKTVADGNGELIDTEDEVGGYPTEVGTPRPIEVPDGVQARQDWLDALEDEFAVDRSIDLSRLYGLVGSAASDKLK